VFSLVILLIRSLAHVASYLTISFFAEEAF
jgi:hypothetical protein